MEAGLKPKQDAIAVEDPKGPYANIIAIREADRNKRVSPNWSRRISRRK